MKSNFVQLVKTWDGGPWECVHSKMAVPPTRGGPASTAWESHNSDDRQTLPMLREGKGRGACALNPFFPTRQSLSNPQYLL